MKLRYFIYNIFLGHTNNLENEDDFDESNILVFSHESNISSALQSTSILSTSQSTSIPSISQSTTILSTSQSKTLPTTSQSTNILEDILPNAQSSGQDISSSAQSIRTRRNYNTKLISVLGPLSFTLFSTMIKLWFIK